MTEAYLDAQRHRRGSQSEHLHEGELTEKDKAKTYHEEANRILGCQHYRRGAKLQCSTCNHWATCRYCHDEQEDHRLIRYVDAALLVLIFNQERYQEHALYALWNASKGRAILPELQYSSCQVLL
jgi:hypothetical protein